jgi:mannosyltransferase
LGYAGLAQRRHDGRGYPMISAQLDKPARRIRSALVFVVVLLFISLLALALRLYRLDSQSLWYDEGFSVYLARMSLTEITARTATDIQPPLYYYLLHGWIQLFGDSEQAVRGLSLVFGLLTVPLMYAVARQLFQSYLAGLLAALLVAVAPLHVWYGQETRMYTLLTFLCLLSSYLLLIASQTKKAWQSLMWWAAYTIVSIAAVYTHYFAFFVLAFQAGYLLLFWAGQGFRPWRLVLGGLASGALTVVAFLPWLPYLLSQYGTDASYLPGRLKLAEVLQETAVVFVSGESVSGSTGFLLAAGYALPVLLCLIALLIQAAHSARATAAGEQRLLPLSYYSLLFLLLYLLLPPALILALAYNTPKFNARYVMASQPAFLLLLAGGPAVLWERRSGSLANVGRETVAVLILIFALGTSAYANYNGYTNRAVARADFRGAARYITKHIAPDETIILSSGHIFPIFDYYAPGVERHLLPDSPTLDITETLDYSIADDLNNWLSDRGGVWLVLWQNDIIDPVGYLTSMLSEVGEEQPVNRDFPQVEVRHYRFSPGSHFADGPTIAHPANFDFGGQIRLLGYNQSGERQVTVYWQTLKPLDKDYRVSLVLRDTLNQSWGQWDGRPAAYGFPTDRWRVGQIVFGRYDLAPMPGTPPGDYGLEVGVYTEQDPIGLDILDAAGAPQGKRAMIGAVRLAVAATTPDQVEVPYGSKTEMGGGLALLGWDLGRDEAQPGDPLLLTLVWAVETQPQADYAVRLRVIDATGQQLAVGTFPPTNAWHPTSIWLPGQAWRGQSTFRLPIQTQPGEAHLTIELVDTNGQSIGPAADLTTLQVLPTERVFAPPNPMVPRHANFGDTVALLGADLSTGPYAPGAVVPLTFYWKALAETDVPYTVFVHLLEPEGRMVSGSDSQPAAGARPTTGWVPGEYIADLHELPIPADLPPGEYIIEVGLYDAGAAAMPRLTIPGEDGKAAVDRVIFGPIRVQ